jgi:hypothetical protein
MVAKHLETEFSDEEIPRRRDDVVRRMANTPPKPHSEMKVGKRKAKASTKASFGVPSDSGKSKQRSK